jgi:hypothetical protein
MKADIQRDERELDTISSNHQRTEKELYHAPMRELEEAETKAIEAISKYYRIKREELTKKSKQRQDIFSEAQERVQRRLERRRAVAAPLKKLPPEILSEIFIQHVEMGGSPWVTLKVSRWWMRVSTNTFRLWRTIRVVPCWPVCDSGTAEQYCSSKKHLQKAMRRAGMVPVRLRLVIDSCKLERDILPFVFESLDRFQSLELLRSPRSQGSTEESEYLDSLRCGVPRNLRELVLDIEWKDEHIVERLLKTFDTSKEGLQCITVPHNRWLPLLARHRKPFLNLRNLSCSGWAGTSTEDELLQKWFSSVKHLESLSITVSLTPFVDVVTLVDNLQELDIQGASLEPLYFLQLPRLKKLVLTSVRPKHPPEFTVSLPQLEVLQIKSNLWTSIRALHCPALHELVLSTGSYEKVPSKPQLSFIWTSDSRCLNPKILHLQVGARDSALITTLRKMTAIEQLHLTIPVGFMLGDVFFDAFSAPKTNRRVRWLPQLRIIEITYTGSWAAGATKLKDGLQKIVSNRAEWAPISSAVLNTVSMSSTPQTHLRHELAVPRKLPESSVVRDGRRMVADTWGPIQSSDTT